MRIRKSMIALVVLLVAAAVSLSAETADWNAGYLQGYADAKAGRPNSVEETRKSTAMNPDDLGVWNVKYYVDSFGDPTDEAYITQRGASSGKFSNSATTNSRLSWYFLIDADSVSIKMMEYGSYPVGYGDYVMEVKDADGKVWEFKLTGGSDRVTITKSYSSFYSQAEDFINILRRELPVKIAIRESGSYATSKYNLGDFDPSGFSNAYARL